MEQTYLKKCSKCQQIKPYQSFSKDKHAKIGVRSQCKECVKEYFKTEKGRRAKQKASRKYRKTGHGQQIILTLVKTKRLEYMQRHNALHPERRKARNAISSLKQQGRLEPQPCEKCGDTKTQAHHDDYNKPLEIRWFCSACHCNYHYWEKECYG
jgi:hypothetical protein